jgi:hypothetical protein
MAADLRFALRTLLHNPGFAAIAIVSLALGIGANAAIFSFADYLLLRPLPVPDTSRVMVISSQFRGESVSGITDSSDTSYPDFDDLRKKARSFAGLTASKFFSFGFAPDKTALPEMKFGALVSGNFFDVLGVHPQLGRGFRADEDKVPGRDAVVVLGHDLWQTEFASNKDIIGKRIFLDGLPFTVVGVGPESFRGPNVFLRADLYVPLAMLPALAGESSGQRILRRLPSSMSSSPENTIPTTTRSGSGSDCTTRTVRGLKSSGWRSRAGTSSRSSPLWSTYTCRWPRTHLTQ